MTADVTGDEREPAAGQPGGPAAAQDQDLNPLQRLIQQRLREQSWSYGVVARRGGLPRSTVYTLAMTRNLVRPPPPPPRPPPAAPRMGPSSGSPRPGRPRPSPPGCTTTTRSRPNGGNTP